MSQAMADEYVHNGKAFYLIPQKEISNPHYVNPGWIMLDELENLFRDYKQKYDQDIDWGFIVLKDIMHSIENYKGKGSTRLVYWFD
jgi:hypothetical protein